MPCFCEGLYWYLRFPTITALDETEYINTFQAGVILEFKLLTLFFFQAFRSQAAKEECVRRFAAKDSRGNIFSCLGQRPEYRLRGKHYLTVEIAPEPSDILWENLETGRGRRACRRLLASSLSVV